MTDFSSPNEAALICELKDKVLEANLNSENFQFSEMAYVRFLRGRKHVVDGALRGMVLI